MSIFTFPGYAGGTQVKTNKFLARPSDLALVKNGSGEIIGSWKPRKGCTQAGLTLQSGKNILGLNGYTQGTNTNQYAAVNNSDDTAASIKNNASGTWNDIGGTTSFPAGALVEFIPFNDQDYIVGRNSAGVPIASGSLVSTTFTQDSLIPGATGGIVFFDQLYLWDCTVAGTRYPSRVYRSSIPTAGVITWDYALQNIQVQTQNGDQLMGAAQAFGRLLFFKQYSLHTWDLSNLTQVANIGTSATRSIATLGSNNVVYLHNSNKQKGIYMWTGTEPKKISRPIDPFIEGMTSTIGDAVAGVNNDHYYCFIGDVTLDADIANYYKIPQTYTNVMLDYSLNDDNWVIHTLPFKVKCFSEYQGNLFFGADNGKVYQWGLGTTDDGTPIELMLVGHNFYGWARHREINRRKVWSAINIMVQKANTAQAFSSVDNDDWKPLGECTSIVNSFTPNVKGYGCKWMLISNSSDFIFESAEYEYDIEGVPLR